MAERIDFLDSNWSQYYAVEKKGMQRYLTARSLSAGQSFKDVIKKIIKGLDEALETVESSMTQADKAMAVYTYFAKEYHIQRICRCTYGI